MQRARLPALLAFLVCILYAPVTQAYEPEIHFYLTALIGHWCGLDEDANRIALSNYSVDIMRSTNAGMAPSQWLNPRKIATRRAFHFPVEKYTNNLVDRNSEWAWETANAAISTANKDRPNFEMFGIGLHTLQDSFAHEGFTPKYGHWTSAPDYPESDPAKLVEAAQATYLAFDLLLKKLGVGGCQKPFDPLAPLLLQWSKTQLTADNTLQEIWETAIEALVQTKIEIKGIEDLKFQKAFFEAADQVWLIKL